MDYLVETTTDRAIIETLKGRSPVILRGSRGVGKSFLLRVAETELLASINTDKVLPVYVTFARATLITDPTAERFLLWMMAKLCNQIVRAASVNGYTLPEGATIAAIRGENTSSARSHLQNIEDSFENAWRGAQEIDPKDVPGPETIRDAVEDLCRHTGLNRIAVFVDEAAHVFLPEQQRQFFTLMRDLRSPFISVKAAVYPGATAFGHSFQPSHDATVLTVDRTVTERQYSEAMREIVLKQDRSISTSIERNGEIFDVLAYAATGNPRILLKTLSRSTPFNRRNVQESIREYYREEIWAEHSSLAERFPGHRELIDWGRTFIESDVLPELHRRNKGGNKETSSYIWVHRDAPQAAREALRLLCYSGILQEGVSGIRATRSEVGTRYMVNLGCQFALNAEPVSYGAQVRRSLSIKRFVEFGANHHAYKKIKDFAISDLDASDNLALTARLATSSSVLDISSFQKSKLAELKLATIGQVLGASERDFTKAYYVGEKRARQMRNAAVAAVLEYLSG
ncbi:hypothetical protein ACFQ68_40300 [Amycolatopsis japonica]|uniref:hypothetical protein n=1 Tax=Amycolatopsis japonica TaxID=208439 RepID=UPI00366BC242